MPFSRHRSLTAALALLSLGLVDACTATGGARLEVEQPFPKQSELDAIAQRPAPPTEKLFTSAPAAIDEWTLTGPLPTETSARAVAGDDALGQALAQHYANDANRRVVTAGMQCVAREIGAFALEHKADPPSDLEAFIVARCGAVTIGPMTTYNLATAPEGAPEGVAPPIDQFVPVIRQIFDEAPPNSAMGAWLGVKGRDYVLAVAAGQRTFGLEPLPMASGQSGYVELRGTMPGDYAWVQGHSTRGEFGYGTCEVLRDAAKAPEDLVLRCPVQPADGVALIEISAAPPGRLLGASILRAMVSPDGSLPNSYRVRAPGSGATGAADAKALAAAINGLRESLGFTPLRVESNQSVLVDNLLPHFLAASRDPNGAALRDQIALGMMAGWKVQGLIRDADFFSFFSHASRSMERALGEALFSPGYRATVLDPQARAIALATLTDDAEEARASMVLTFEFFEPRNYAAEEAAFLDELDRQRRARGLAPVVRIGGPVSNRVMSDGMARVERGESDPADEINDVLQRFVERTGGTRSFYSMIYSTLVLDGWKPTFARELLESTQVEIAIKIGHYRPEGAAWGHHIVFTVFTIIRD